MGGRFMVVPAAYVVFRRKDQVLLQLRQNTGYMDEHWACAAAGHVESDESVVEAAIREAQEETGVVIAASALAPICTMHRTQGDGNADNERVDFFFEVREWSGEPQIAEPEKSGGLAWFNLDALPANVVPHELVVLSTLASGLTPQPILVHGWQQFAKLEA